MGPDFRRDEDTFSFDPWVHGKPLLQGSTDLFFIQAAFCGSAT
jgi:hypothetical protein